MSSSLVDRLVSFSEFVLEKGRVRKRPRFNRSDIFGALADAAERTRKCVILYRRKGIGEREYYVAPYSFRWNGDEELLYAHDFVDGHTKSFYMSKITGIHVTNNRFTPKYEVEIG